MARDPVFGMEVDENITRYRAIYEGKVYYFCSRSCQKEFEKEPIKYTLNEAEERHMTHHGGFYGGCCGAPIRGVGW
ncbi:YHS domain-containing protein [Candidatus Bathyarchaeota archaeon]|nr:YHS domain-containing protein [Candidatus Bathyarchaeota archaeon]